MSPLDSFWNGVLSLLTPLVTPDWGKLIGLIPWLLLLMVLAFLALLARAWVRLLGSQPRRGPKVQKPDLRPVIVGHVAVVIVGACIVASSFIVGAQAPGWTGATSAFGLVVNVPLLILGLIVAIGAVGNAIRLWDRNGREEVEPDVVDRGLSVMRRHPSRAKRVVAFVIGVVLAGTSIALGTVPGYTGGDPKNVAVIPLLLLGLVLAVGSVGSAIAAIWSHDPDFEAPPAGDESSALVPSGH